MKNQRLQNYFAKRNHRVLADTLVVTGRRLLRAERPCNGVPTCHREERSDVAIFYHQKGRLLRRSTPLNDNKRGNRDDAFFPLVSLKSKRTSMKGINYAKTRL